MQELQKEMCKAGIIEEMMEDTMAMSDDEVHNLKMKGSLAEFRLALRN